MIPVLMRLGFWQLDRAADKHHLRQLSELRQNMEVQEIESIIHLSSVDMSYRKVALRGDYINDKNILIDNQIFHSTFGYDVVTPFRLSSNGLVVFISRGWIQGSLDRTRYPVIAPIDGELELIARVFVPSKTPYLIGPAEDNKGWPKRVAFINFEELQVDFEKPLFPFVLRLEEGVEGVLSRHWLPAGGGLKPESHEGYAFQWFALAATLGVCYLAYLFNFIGFKRNKKNQANIS